ncbi:MAG: chitobiase/beta-hexosaminidase C-terminal domain-containing protein [Prevotellaceae bacterium]|jgi:exo-beta-1,3-glucanase (GH17 family)|nr:chitobiase/beta-hexosaminidase C-terminal domain-containing protein [Prevotellaceae bacterium]
MKTLNLKSRKSIVRGAVAGVVMMFVFSAVSCKDKDKDEPKSSACDIISFIIADDVWDVNGTNITHTYPAGTQETSLSPTITLSPGATVNPASGAAQNFFTAEGITYTVTAEDGVTKKTYIAKATKTQSATCDIVSFTVNDATWEINGTEITHTYPAETQETSLSPTITLSPGATVNPASGAAQNFFTAEGVTYTVTAEDGVTKKTYTAKATKTQSAAIVISYIPPTGEGGVVEGRVIWNSITESNAAQYAVVAMLRSSWGSDYVKPYNNSYLNAIDATGKFSINITTGGQGDFDIVDVGFYFVLRATFDGIDGSSVNAGYMDGKYIGQSLTVNRSDFWANRPLSPEPNILPGLTDAGQRITLSCQSGGVILYTQDGSDPVTSASALTYNANTTLAVPSDRSLLIKAVTRVSETFSETVSLVWMPREPLTTPFWGLNVSLALNGESFGHTLSEEATRTRMAPVVPLTKWVRTFGTLNNGHPYINKIAKEQGLRTMIGVYVTNSSSDNNAQIQGLRQILATGPAPDLIAVGNECSLLGIAPETFVACIDAVRKAVQDAGFVIPIGSVDIANTSWSRAALERLDFIGVNIYCGTWDQTPENEMSNALIRTYNSQVAAFPSKFVLLTETGTPYSGGQYNVGNSSQTPSQQKAAKYLDEFLDWIVRDNIPAFYFEAYDEPVKSQNGGHSIEQYFGLMNGNLELHPFYREIVNNHSSNE